MSSQPAIETAPTGIWLPLRNGDFRLLLGSNALWWTTMFMETLLFGWLVLEITNSPWMVALVGFCRSLPFLLFGVWGGTAADRFGRRRIIIAAQAANFLVYLGLSCAIFAGVLQLWHLAAGALVLGSAWSFDWPARRALMPDLIGKQQTVEAMVLENLMQGCARMIGPLIAGVLVAMIGPLGCISCMTVFSASALVLVHQLSEHKLRRESIARRVSPWSTLSQSLKYVTGNEVILGVMLVTVVMNLLMIPYLTLLPIFARDVLQQGPMGLGLLGAAAGVGCFAGLFVTTYLRRILSNGWIFVGGTFAMAVALVVFSLSQLYGLSWAMLFIVGIGQVCFGVMQSSIILLTASDAMRGQTMGILVLAIGSDPIGKLLTGALAEQIGTPLAVGIEAAVAAILLVAISVFLPGLCAQGETPEKRQSNP
jgi:MFS family permease